MGVPLPRLVPRFKGFRLGVQVATGRAVPLLCQTTVAVAGWSFQPSCVSAGPLLSAHLLRLLC
jgi:hypothetical protein